MELRSVDITNFKSIENIMLDIEKDCKILVGLSESGKTNLLTALRTLDSTVVVDKSFVKEGTRKDNEATIDFELALTKKEKELIVQELLKISKDLDNLVIKDGKKISLIDFMNFRFVYRVNIRNNTRKFLHYEYNLTDNYILNENYIIINASDSNKINVHKNFDDTNVELNSFSIVSSKDYNYSDGINIKELYDYLEERAIEIIKEKSFEIPKVLYWEYDEKYLLPSEVNIEEFLNNNNICIPLKNMFELCDIYDIKEEYNDKKEMGESSVQNLLDEISNTVDSYLKKVWKSMPKDTKIVLQEVENKIKIRIKDSKNTYSADKRSDGFKRIVTFLLMISIDNKNNYLNNTLILIDEPDSKIDIPGLEYLRDELINIGKNNYVIYSTHSTDMIDNGNIDRHIIIKKNNESSNIEVANENNYMDVATLYRALGMNVYSVINEQNIVFEGWTDKLMFELSVGKKHTVFKNVGITHLSGITKANQYAEFWGLLSKKYYIISDGDETALQMKESFVENKYDGNWITYSDLTGGKVITLEDFIKDDKILKTAKEYAKEHGYINELKEETLDTDNKCSVIENWISLNSGKKDIKNKLKKFKNMLYTNLKKTDINDKYDSFITELIKIMNKKDEK